MPRGPRGEKRPADVIGAAVMVAKSRRARWKKSPRSNLEGCAAAVRGPRRALNRSLQSSAAQLQKGLPQNVGAKYHQYPKTDQYTGCRKKADSASVQ
jgi:hypothetical protein